MLAVALLGTFAVAGARALHLQVYRAESLQTRADQQRRRLLELIPERGAIYDRNGRELAVSIPGTSVFGDPAALLSNTEAVRSLATALGLAVPDLRRRLESAGRRFAWIERRISPDRERAVRELSLEGVGLVREPHRYYPKKTLAGQVVGFVGIDGTGLGGIEYRYDGALRGTPGRIWAERDARGQLMFADVPDSSSGRGRSLVLTLDEAIQHIAEEELARAVEQSRARGGTVVVLDPRSGELLAVAQSPAFNPNSLAGTRAEDQKLTAAVDVYEPGSTFKALFLGLLLDRGLAKPSDLVFCENGEWTVHRRTIHDHEPHGWLSVEDVLKVSSNIGVAKLSEKISPQVLYEGLRGFGMGIPSGVGLPGESRGILPAVGEWSKITPKTIAYGQGVSATALQVAAAFAAIANDGVRMQPLLVQAVVDDAGRRIEEFGPIAAERALAPATARTLTRLLERVVHAEGGTAAGAAVPGFRVAGKTGTAWKPDTVNGGYLRGKVVVSFAGFVPARTPRLTILVTVDEPTKGSRYGGTIAAPAFREIARRTLAYLRVPSEEATGEARATPAPAAADARGKREMTSRGDMPDVRGLTMREVLRQVERSGLAMQLTLLGSGVAMSQDPSPGTPLREGDDARVVFRPLL